MNSDLQITDSNKWQKQPITLKNLRLVIQYMPRAIQTRTISYQHNSIKQMSSRRGYPARQTNQRPNPSNSIDSQ